MESLSAVYVTASSKEEAEKIGKEIVSRKLAACANICGDVRSFYWWENKVDSSNEAVILFKTKESLFPELEKAVKELHSYACPCIVSFPIGAASDGFAEWIIKNTL
ncbi:MAG: divalent-cation tolerance protein CutA [Candidatus Omnitrophica bacterium]|nr:divalent-cation tolerance protein CutA [Candidatus Omnitrophota bacterium]